jgi:3-deoxy-D-manno-octulosonic-acid transferase
MNTNRIFFIYRHVFEPFARVSLQFLHPLLPQKIQQIVRLKNEVLPRILGMSFDTAPFWIHASSGEIEYARPVFRELKKQFPGIPILVTFSSPSALPILQALSEVDFFFVLPWDTAPQMSLFLDKIRPRCLLIARTDVWPEMMEQAALKKIPSLLFSGTLVKNSGRLRGLAGILSRRSFRQLNNIYCVSQQDLETFKSLDQELPVKVTGDTRFEQVLNRLANPRKLKMALKPASEKNILVAGSTWPEDDQILVRTLLLNPEMNCIWAPHEVSPHSLRDLEAVLKKNGLSFVRYSQSEVWDRTQARILLIDQVGVLADLYAWGSVAFVGGSFREKVHSVMEALAAGKPVILGPYFENNREAQEFSLIRFQEKGGQQAAALMVCLVSRVLNVRQFDERIKQLSSLSEAATKDLTSLIFREVKNRVGATRIVVEWVKANLNERVRKVPFDH